MKHLVVTTALTLTAGCIDNSNLVGYRLSTEPDANPNSDSEPPPNTTLPPLPVLGNVQAQVSGDAVSIRFEPLPGAVDYRVYELPNNADVSVASDGEVLIESALYRCAGNRLTPPIAIDGEEPLKSGYMKTLVDGQDVNGYTRSLEEATLGHVYLTPGRDRVPVYALGDSDPAAENEFYFMRWGASRVKHYVTSDAEREQLLARGFRDDGIAFYVPTTASDETHPIFTSTDEQARYYFTDGAEARVRLNAEFAFSVLTSAAPTTAPLMRVFYLNLGGTSHDELVAGQPRFLRARQQGDELPLFELHYSGLERPTTLVVEALNPGCPRLPGILAPISLPSSPEHPAWLTPDEARALDPEGALYINGQHAPDSRPRAVARAFVEVSPEPAPNLDWTMGFGPSETLGTFNDEPCGDPSGNCFQDFRRRSESFDTSFLYVEDDRQAFGTLFGELWLAYADLQSGVNGKFRMTPTTTAQMATDSFLYVTMEVNSFTTGRRYPQILISDQEPPVQHTMSEGNTLIIHPYGEWPNFCELQVCDHRSWDVNDHCPYADLEHEFDTTPPETVLSLLPHPELGEHVGLDRSTRFEVYASMTRAYLFLNGDPYGCVDLPVSGVPAGTVSVTFGDVLFHSDIDQLQFYTFVEETLQHDAQRHFDNLGFSSGVSAPDWNETRFPCVSRFFER